jgi:uncharacterized protein
MPVTPTYPGVYIEEIPSGVRTISGVSTSVTAFLGTARRGPIHDAVRILNFGDFERRFGGLQADSELGYAVRQFFQNGGGEAWVVRVVGAATTATLVLRDASNRQVLDVTALDEGSAGNAIQVRVDHATDVPGSTFNLLVSYATAEGGSTVEQYPSLSMNSSDPRYVESVVNGASALVRVTRRNLPAPIATAPGTSTSGVLSGNVQALITAEANQFLVSANGLPPVPVVLVPADANGGDLATQLGTLATAIRDRVRAAAGNEAAYGQFNVTVVGGNRLELRSGVTGETASVRVYPGERGDISAALKLGSLNGGDERDGVSGARPAEVPVPGRLTGGVVTDPDLAAAPLPAAHRVAVALDGGRTVEVSLGTAAAVGADTAARTADVAARLQAAVRGAGAGDPAFAGFTVTVSNDNRLVLSSGSRGAGSSVQVTAASAQDAAVNLRLVNEATSAAGTNVTLAGGSESPITGSNAFAAYSGSRSQRTGIYALEAVDLFNLMVLPGVTDTGIIAEAAAYCRERRAFLIVDAPRAATTPDAMATLARGPALPKTDRAAVYFPWIRIADPLNGGKPRLAPPSGTIAGLFARTDGTRGIWKAPAGTEASLAGVQGVDYVLTDAENGILNPQGVNAIRLLPGFGPVAWGARTLRGADQLADEWKYVPVRRLALYIEESLYRGTQWAVFEPNDEPLWSQIRLNVGAFMHNLFRQGAFQGNTPARAYLVKCDAETTTQNDINLGIVNILVGFAPLKPAEFVIIRLQQKAGQVTA